jgi:hypothetical protein
VFVCDVQFYYARNHLKTILGDSFLSQQA